MSAAYHVQPPEPFTFSRPEEWPKWARRFERFRSASGLAEKDEVVQVNTLLYSMGDEADDVLRSFALSEADQKKYSEVKGRFDQHFVKKRNVIFERAKFNMRKQEEGESVDSFVTDLYALAEHCSYGGLHDEMIRDRLVVGLQSAKLSEKLQLDADLTLEKAITQVRQSEAIKLQQSVLRGEGAVKPDTTVGSVNKGKPPQHPKQVYQSGGPPTTPTVCSWCGFTPKHGRAQCPARNAECRKCKKRGHFQKVCRAQAQSQSQAGVGVVEESADVPFLGAVSRDGDNSWLIRLQLNNKHVQFQIDSGAEVTVIPEKVFSQLRGVSLRPSKRTLKGPLQSTLPVRGQFMGSLVWGDREVQQEVYVVNRLCRPLLGQPAIEALRLLVRVGTVAEDKSPAQRFPHLFHGLGRMQGEYTIQLKDGAVPFALTTPRRVAIPLMESVKAELENMEKLGVISRIVAPTDWCAGIVVVPKSNKRVRICVDLTKLNENVRRERHILPAVEQTLAQVAGARVFSKLDANSGFWQVPLSRESAKLTTFITPFGRYHFNRLPFGITSAPEHFQRRMQAVLQGLEGVVCLMDDVLVHGRTQAEHDQRLTAVLEKLMESGLTLNKDKCVFSQACVKFLGQVLTPSGISSDPDKVSAVVQMRQPTNVSEVRRLLGMVNQLSKFVPNLADMTKPLRDLLSKHNQWTWDKPQQGAYTRIKEALTTTPILAPFDTGLKTIVSADASSYGLGAVLLQKQKNGEIWAVAYISRAMTPTEQRYAQIEKEGLALTWACERFRDYLVGLNFHVETDHKPLVPLFSNKLLDELPLRVQRFRMRLMRFSFSISHVPGKELSTADALSRAPISASDELLSDEVDAYVQMATLSDLVTEKTLEVVRSYQKNDVVCKHIVAYCRDGWPCKVPDLLKPYYSIAGELSIRDDLLVRGSRIVIPANMRADVLAKLHAGHQGISKSRLRARQSVWWPGMSTDLEQVVLKCSECARSRPPQTEPLMSTSMPTLPWQKVATHLFEWKKGHYLLIVDYFSRWIEIARLEQTTSRCVIEHTKSLFARHGIPEVVVSDNGPQYSSDMFSQFAKDYGFLHVTSSPHYPQANGEAERAVKTIKSLLHKATDPYQALLAYRSTPTAVGYAPSELLMNRKLRTTVPISRDLRVPAVPDYTAIAEKDKREKERQAKNFNARHAVRELPALLPGDEVCVRDREETGTIMSETTPRSYLVQTPEGTFRRNRRHVIEMSQHESGDKPPQPDTVSNDLSETTSTNDSSYSADPSDGRRQYSTRLRSGKTVRPPERFDNSWNISEQP